ncbi:MAG: GTPase ObgE [Bacteroidota bacterium]
MSSPNFIDYVKFHARSGQGGAGSAHFRREKFVPKGGPDGGDGGRGGHIILRGNTQLWTLLHLKYRKHVMAKKGEGGGPSRKSGAQGEDIVLDVPLGTIVRLDESEEVVAEITENGQEVIILEGGRGGLGNDHFKSSTNQSPHYAQPGEPAKEAWFILELKVLADVGLIGFPNAGKSTLLSVISAAKPEIADYPFTTLTPNLGVVEYRDFQSFIVADIPGIIEGAAEGRGLGTRFLRHIERNSILLFVIPADADDINQEYQTLLNELEAYNPEMMDKKRLLAISKADLLDQELREAIQAEIDVPIPFLFISSAQNYQITELKDLIWQTLHA